MFDYELQKFEQLGREVAGVFTADDAPMVTHHERKQKRFAFNLDWNKPDERTIGQGLLKHKQERNMVSVIRDAVRLYFDLAGGNVDVLCELFPGIIAAIRAQAQPVAAAPAPKPIALQTVAPPPEDTDDSALLSIKKAESSGKQSAGNFLQSAFNLVD
jgi:hypothetical protein